MEVPNGQKPIQALPPAPSSKSNNSPETSQRTVSTSQTNGSSSYNSPAPLPPGQRPVIPPQQARIEREQPLDKIGSKPNQLAPRNNYSNRDPNRGDPNRGRGRGRGFQTPAT